MHATGLKGVMDKVGGEEGMIGIMSPAEKLEKIGAAAGMATS